MKHLIICLCLMLSAGRISACPPRALGLRELVHGSKIIIAGYVLRILPQQYQGQIDSCYEEAIVSVTKTLKGSILQDTVLISYDNCGLYNWPCKLKTGMHVLAFLDAADDRCIPHDLSPTGIKLYDDEASAAVYEQRINELLSIYQLPANQQLPAIAEWEVLCAENPATRAEAMHDLSADSAFGVRYFEYSLHYRLDHDDPGPYCYLIDAQTTRLRSALLATQHAQLCDYDLLDLIYTPGDKELTQWTLSALQQMDNSNYWLASDLMEYLLPKTEKGRLREMIAQVKTLGYKAGKEQRVKKLINDFVVIIAKRNKY